jgi:hypothetical protein
MKEHHLTLSSSNPKTGPIPVSTHTIRTCPSTCKIKKECYAKNSLLAHHWAKVSERKSPAVSWSNFISSVKRLAVGQLWRYAQAGDLPGYGNDIDEAMFKQLVRANKGKRGFSYTRKPLTKINVSLFELANANGFLKPIF